MAVELAGNPKPLARLQGVLHRKGIDSAKRVEGNPVPAGNPDQRFAGTHPVGCQPSMISALAG